jgi:NhaA family Na+:H+ antiporter
MKHRIHRIVHHRIFSPIGYFLRDSRAVGVILIVNTIISLTLANNVFSGNWYKGIWNAEIHIPGFIKLPGTPIEWLNSFLMAFFFTMAGMEIKRELLAGELSSFKKAILPFGAALGGMMVPAIIFVLFNTYSSYIHGWGIPTATDIAFSLGVASLLGKRIPFGLKILLMALAIIDDLGAIVVIALFYGGQIYWAYLLAAAVVYALLLACNFFKIKFGALQIILGLLIWYLMFNSGIEASITGVLFAFAVRVKDLPVLEKALHNVVNFFILPLFALANTAIGLPSNASEALGTTVSQGIIAGLVIGKPLGIFLVSRLLVGLKIASLPKHVNWKQVFGMGTLAGIGFTMSIFTTMLAFKEESVRDIAKISILLAVVFSVIISVVYFYLIDLRIFRTKTAHAATLPSTDLKFNTTAGE